MKPVVLLLVAITSVLPGCSRRISTPPAPRTEAEIRRAIIETKLKSLATEPHKDPNSPAAWIAVDDDKGTTWKAMQPVVINDLLPRDEALRVARQRARLGAMVLFWELMEAKSDHNKNDPSTISISVDIPPRVFQTAELQKEEIKDNGTGLYATYVWKISKNLDTKVRDTRETPSARQKKLPVVPPTVFTRRLVEASGICETKYFLNGNPYDECKYDLRTGGDDDFYQREWYENGREYERITKSRTACSMTVWYDTGQLAGERIVQQGHERVARYRKDGSVINIVDTKNDN